MCRYRAAGPTVQDRVRQGPALQGHTVLSGEVYFKSSHVPDSQNLQIAGQGQGKSGYFEPGPEALTRAHLRLPVARCHDQLGRYRGEEGDWWTPEGPQGPPELVRRARRHLDP